MCSIRQLRVICNLQGGAGAVKDNKVIKMHREGNFKTISKNGRNTNDPSEGTQSSLSSSSSSSRRKESGVKPPHPQNSISPSRGTCNGNGVESKSATWHGYRQKKLSDSTEMKTNVVDGQVLTHNKVATGRTIQCTLQERTLTVQGLG